MNGSHTGCSTHGVGLPCVTHDGTPMSLKEEEDMYDNGDDVCIHIIRLYAEPEQRLMVEDNHTPSQWRNDYGV